MNSEKLIRTTLQMSFFFNLGAAYLLVFPSSDLAQLAGFTVSTSPMHTALAALAVASLGLAYGWLALQPTIDKPLLAFGAFVKGGAFLTFAVQWLLDVVTGSWKAGAIRKRRYFTGCYMVQLVNSPLKGL